MVGSSSTGGSSEPELRIFIIFKSFSTYDDYQKVIINIMQHKLSTVGPNAKTEDVLMLFLTLQLLTIFL